MPQMRDGRLDWSAEELAADAKARGGGVRYTVDEMNGPTRREFGRYAEAVAYAHEVATEVGYPTEISISRPEGYYLVAVVHPDGSVSKV